MGRILIVLAALISMGTAANATTLAAGGLFGGILQNTATCRLFNAGDSPVSILRKEIFREGITLPLQLTFDFCGGVLAAGALCVIQVNGISNVSHACKFVISPDGALVRGDLQISNGSTVLQNASITQA